jgi:ribosomal-protein-serine acetyltransferase
MFVLRVNREVTLQLRDERHAQETFDLIKKNKHLRDWMQWYEVVKTLKDSINNIEGNIEDWEMKTDYHLGIFYHEQIVGMISLHGINYLANKAAIGYWLDKDYEGKGIITSSVRVLMEYGFNELGINRIEIGAAVTNTRSRLIPERLGFKLEGILRENMLLNGMYLDMAIYGMLKSEYKELNDLNK